MPVAPDLDGYVAAQVRKREVLGSPVVFHFPSAVVWPEDAVIDPNTGRPYDPLVEPSSESGSEPLEMTLSVAFKPARGSLRDDTEDSRIGMEKVNIALTWVTPEEFGAPNCIVNATSFDYAGDNYLIRKTTEESIGGKPWRVLIWGERQAAEGAL